MLNYAKEPDNFKTIKDYENFFKWFYNSFFKDKFKSSFNPEIIIEANENVRRQLYIEGLPKEEIEKYCANITLYELKQHHESIFGTPTLSGPYFKR